MKPHSPHFYPVDQPSTFEFFDRFPDEDSARDYIINARWPDGVTCAHCGHDEVYRIRNGKLFRCKDKECAKQFTVRIGTVMEDSPLPLRKWLFAMYLFGIHPKGVASTNMAKMIGVTQKTAWHMDHRIRRAFEYEGIILDGIVEVDETYIGGKEKNKHASKKQNAGRGPVGKQAVLGLVERGGSAVAFPIDGTALDNLSGNVNTMVANGSTVYTDNHGGYNAIDPTMKHETVNHTAGEYVRGEAHTNSVESLWSLLKRAHYGIYHHWSAKHGHRYSSEISYRQSLRSIPAFDESDGSGITIIRLLVSGMVGKRLTYRDLAHG